MNKLQKLLPFPELGVPAPVSRKSLKNYHVYDPEVVIDLLLKDPRSFRQLSLKKQANIRAVIEHNLLSIADTLDVIKVKCGYCYNSMSKESISGLPNCENCSLNGDNGRCFDIKAYKDMMLCKTRSKLLVAHESWCRSLGIHDLLMG